MEFCMEFYLNLIFNFGLQQMILVTSAWNQYSKFGSNINREPKK